MEEENEKLKQLLLDGLEKYNKKELAKKLGISRGTLYNYCIELGIDYKSFGVKNRLIRMNNILDTLKK